MIRSLKTPFGLRGADIVSADDQLVPLGDACGCFCPSPACNGPLIKRRDTVSAHFAHKPNAPCKGIPGTREGALESGLHRLAKQALNAKPQLMLPGVVLFPKGNIADFRVQQPDAVVEFTKVEAGEIAIEAAPASPKADAVLTLRSGDKLFVEFRVCHKVDAEKAQRLKELKARTLEIDLRPFLEKRFSIADIQHFLISSPSDRKWVYDPDQEAKHQIQSKASLEDQCPRGLGRATHQNCRGCPCRLSAEGRPIVCTGAEMVYSRSTLEQALRGELPVEHDYFPRRRKERQAYIANLNRSQENERAWKAIAEKRPEVSLIYASLESIANSRRSRFRRCIASLSGFVRQNRFDQSCSQVAKVGMHTWRDRLAKAKSGIEGHRPRILRKKEREEYQRRKLSRTKKKT